MQCEVGRRSGALVVHREGHGSDLGRIAKPAIRHYTRTAPHHQTRDEMVGDKEGVFVIPAHLADEVATEAVEMTAFEDFVTEEVLKGCSILGLYPATDEQARIDFAAWRVAKNR